MVVVRGKGDDPILHSTFDRERQEQEENHKIPNTYFENLRRLGKEYAEQYKVHEALRDQIIEAHGWDSPEMDAW